MDEYECYLHMWGRQSSLLSTWNHRGMKFWPTETVMGSRFFYQVTTPFYLLVKSMGILDHGTYWLVATVVFPPMRYGWLVGMIFSLYVSLIFARELFYKRKFFDAFIWSCHPWSHTCVSWSICCLCAHGMAAISIYTYNQGIALIFQSYSFRVDLILWIGWR